MEFTDTEKSYVDIVVFWFPNSLTANQIIRL